VLLLEVARGLAALWVFLFHVRPLFEISSPVVYQLSAYGSLGVPMFFVISGYVITYSAESNLEKKNSPVVFLRSRFLRIYPTFWVSVVVVLILPYLLELISSLKSGVYTTPENLISKYSNIEWSNFLLLSKVFWATSDDLQAEFNAINSVYWTLAIEFQFYLVVFVSLFFKSHYKYAIGLVSIVSLLVMFVPLQANYGLFINYWPSFLVGIVLAYMHRNGIYVTSLLTNKTSQLAAFVFVSMLIICSVVFSSSVVLFAVCFGLFLWVISGFEKCLNKIHGDENIIHYWLLKPWLVLGAMSYSVYLLHGKLYQLPYMFVRQVVDVNNFLSGLLIIIGTLFICYPFYLFVESRFLSKSYKQLQDKALA
jgi:peptidoglycan/LPS O-acetylase OafA/YrhL